MVFDDDAMAFIDIVKDMNIPIPGEDDIGYEVVGDDGEVIATIEIAWPDHKTGFMTAEQIEDKGVVETLGWKILDLVNVFNAENIFGGDIE